MRVHKRERESQRMATAQLRRGAGRARISREHPNSALAALRRAPVGADPCAATRCARCRNAARAALTALAALAGWRANAAALDRRDGGSHISQACFFIESARALAQAQRLARHLALQHDGQQENSDEERARGHVCEPQHDLPPGSTLVTVMYYMIAVGLSPIVDSI